MKWMALAVAAVALTPLSGFAQLKWETTELTIPADPTKDTAIATFPVVNAGDKTVNIFGLKGTCGCTNVQMDKKVLEPGEKSEVVATIDLGARIQNKNVQVAVETDDPEGSDAILKIATETRDFVKVEPDMLRWDSGEALAAKTAEITLNLDKAKVTSLGSLPAGFKADLKTIEEGKRYQLEVTPTEKPQSTVNYVVDMVLEIPSSDPWPKIKMMGVPLLVAP